MAVLAGIATLDAVLRAHEGALGGDFTAYRNHACRVAKLCAALSGADAHQLETIAVAAAFHDLGIWTAGTFDYLEPSVRLAAAHLEATGRPELAQQVAEMIRQHHKVTPWRGAPDGLVEAFRRADWVDVTRGALRFGLPRRLVRELYAAWPGAGFHRLLLRLELRRLRTHPLSPLPMVRL